MRRTIVLGCGVLIAVAAGCGGSSKPGGTGGTSAGGTTGTGGTGTGGSGTGGSGTGGSGTGGSGTGGAATAGTGAGGTGTGTGGTGGGPRTVTFASADAIVFAAAQDGDGSWQPFAGGVGSNYALQVTGERYGVAYGCGSAAGDSITITVIQATVTETTRVTVACGGLVTANPATVTGTIGGLTGTQTAQIDVASRGGQATAAMPAYSIAMVPSGAWDLFARRMTTAPTFDRMIRRNAVTVGAGATFNFDFASEGFAPEMHPVTFQGAAASETTSLLVIFRNAGGSPFGMGPFSTGSYPSLPAAERRAGDIHGVTAGATDTAANTRRNVRRSLIAAMDFTASLPPLPPAPTITAAGSTPYIRPRATIPAAAGLSFDRYDVSYTQRETAPARTRSWSVELTRGWIASAAATDYTLPDLSALAAFQAWWGLVAAVDTQWQQFANWGSAGVSDLLRADQTPAELDGHENKSTQRTGNVTF